MKLSRFSELFGRKSSKDQLGGTGIQRSKSLKFLKGNKVETELGHTPRVKSDPFPSPLATPPEINTNLSKEERGTFVKAVATVKNQSSISSEDAFSAFFPENFCQKRASFMLMYLKREVFIPLLERTHSFLIDTLLESIGDRLFTLFYVIKVVKTGPIRSEAMAEAQALVKQSQLSSHQIGCRETAYAVYYSLQKFKSQYQLRSDLIQSIILKANEILSTCIEKEFKLSPHEQESMYVFQQAMSNVRCPTPKLLVQKLMPHEL